MSETSPAALARGLIRASDHAALATTARAETPEAGSAYAALVLTACGHDGSPLLLISALAEHTRNLAEDPRLSLLYDGTAGLEDRLTGARVTVTGRAERNEDPALRARFLTRHPGAALYAGFRDFALYRVVVGRAHLVAGFGRIHWVTADALLLDTAAAAPLAAAEADIVAHMNADHADAVDLYATALLGAEGEGWRLTGVDPEGADLRRGATVLRLAFPAPIADAAGARAALVGLVKQARQAAAER